MASSREDLLARIQTGGDAVTQLDEAIDAAASATLERKRIEAHPREIYETLDQSADRALTKEARDNATHESNWEGRLDDASRLLLWGSFVPAVLAVPFLLAPLELVDSLTTFVSKLPWNLGVGLGGLAVAVVMEVTSFVTSTFASSRADSGIMWHKRADQIEADMSQQRDQALDNAIAQQQTAYDQAVAKAQVAAGMALHDLADALDVPSLVESWIAQRINRLNGASDVDDFRPLTAPAPADASPVQSTPPVQSGRPERSGPERGIAPPHPTPSA